MSSIVDTKRRLGENDPFDLHYYPLVHHQFLVAACLAKVKLVGVVHEKIVIHHNSLWLLTHQRISQDAPTGIPLRSYQSSRSASTFGSIGL